MQSRATDYPCIQLRIATQVLEYPIKGCINYELLRSERYLRVSYALHRCDDSGYHDILKVALCHIQVQINSLNVAETLSRRLDRF
jgi:hypothetical protein